MSTTSDSHPSTITREDETPHEGNNLAVTVVLFLVLFVLFAAGLYVMSLFTIAWWLFVVGLGMSLLALFITFSVIPHYLT
jgi:fatty acid desaturase